jgi:glycosyltransferase involved in cell wall biosynthesis
MCRPCGAFARGIGFLFSENDAIMAPGNIGVVLKGYPRLSETFIAQEIAELERRGFRVTIISLRHPTDVRKHPVHEEISAAVHYLPEYLHQEPLRVFRAWRVARRLPGYAAAFAVFWRDFRRDMTRNRIRRFGQALVIAAEYSSKIDFFYCHFIHTPASATRYASIMCGVPFAISAHAKDIWTTPDWEIHEKLDDCAWCVTCTEAGMKALRRNATDEGKVHLVYHGIDFSRFGEARRHSDRDGSNPADPVRILTVGRAVAKKGLDTMIDALAMLPGDLHWRWTHIGGGPLRKALIGRARTLGLLDRCEFHGALPQAEVLSAYRAADMFVLPCRIDGTGDRDGLPNVIVEALSQSLPVITTPVSGAPELVADGVSGLFVEPDDPTGLAAAIAELARDPKRRVDLGRRGDKDVRRRLDHRKAIAPLVALLEKSGKLVSEPAS